MPLHPSPSPRAIARTLLRPRVVEGIRECMDEWLRSPRQQARPSMSARATASHVNQQKRSAGQACGHQQPQSWWQKEALWVTLPQARWGCGQCTCAVIVVVVVGVNRKLAARAHVAGSAGAYKAGEVGIAAATVGAGSSGTRIGALTAVTASEAQRTGAAAQATALQARATVGAGTAGTVVQVMLAAWPCEAGAAAAAQGVA